MLEFLGFLRLSLVDILDIAVVALLLYVLFRWLRGTNAVNIFIAIVLLVLIRIFAVAAGMKLLASLMGTIIDVGAIALIIIFQPEIRQFLARVGRKTGMARERHALLGRIFRGAASAVDTEAVKELTQACSDMSATKTGALIVLQHTSDLQDIISSGDRLDADISSRLLENIFFKNSPLHDGAVIIGHGRIIAARCTLPMTSRTDLPAKYGMRHKSAVGVTETSDADCIVVSEQRGTISFVRDGVISEIDNINTLKLMLDHKEDKSR